MNRKFGSIFSSVLDKINPSSSELSVMENLVKEFISKLKKNLSKLKLNPEIFIGGSFAKKTVIKKGIYDVDVFLRFSGKDYDNSKISSLTKKLLKGFKFSQIHGSRDYFRIKLSDNLMVELIPVKKVNKVSESDNITDLSYSHVKYINKKIKSKKILDDIKLAKAFCHANDCYGAESYIKGFSGYSLELLVYYYGSFINFLKAVSRWNKKEKIVIDIEKHYKNKQTILLDVNGAKLESPIILIDPTYKQRNALAALSENKLIEFQKMCNKFLKNPSERFFEKENYNFDKIKSSVKSGSQFILLEIKTQKQEGDIAGSKLLKFYEHLNLEVKRFFEVNKKGFEYYGNKDAKYFFVVKPKKEILYEGPELEDNKNVLKFKKKHENTFAKGKHIYSKSKVNFSLEDFILNWKKKYSKRMKEMAISEIKIIPL